MKNLPTPPDGPNPANQEDSCHQLKHANEKLGLAPRSTVADASRKKRASAWKDNAKNHDNIRPPIQQARNIRHDIPQLLILRTIHSNSPSSIFYAVKGHLARITALVLRLLLLLLHVLGTTHDYSIAARLSVHVCLKNE